jgi:hypothetical protein
MNDTKRFGSFFRAMVGENKVHQQKGIVLAAMCSLSGKTPQGVEAD